MVTQLEQHRNAAASIKALEHRFMAYGVELTRVERFRHLGRILSMEDNNIPVMQRQPNWA